MLLPFSNGVPNPLTVSRGGTNNNVAYTAGSIIFSDGTKLTQNNSKLFWDNTNNSLLVGTNTDFSDPFGPHTLLITSPNGKNAFALQNSAETIQVSMYLDNTSANAPMQFGTITNSNYGFFVNNGAPSWVFNKNGGFNIGGGGNALPSGLYITVAGKNQIALNSAGSNIGMIINPSSTSWALGYQSGLGQGPGTSVLTWNDSGQILVANKISSYNGITTAGWGVPSIYGQGRSTAQTGAVASVATYTVGASDGSFIVSANANVTTFVAGTFNVTVSYTDETNTAQTLKLNFSSLTGTLGIAIAASGPFEGIPAHIRCKASTSITIATSGTFTSLTYNVEGAIQQIA